MTEEERATELNSAWYDHIKFIEAETVKNSAERNTMLILLYSNNDLMKRITEALEKIASK